MSSWFSNALSATSQGISTLKSKYLATEADGDTEDDTHVCRVLRGYYTEKGRSFPPWLPPDPKAPAPPPVQQAPSYSNARYGGMSQNQSSTGGGGGGGGGLSSLWDSNPPPQQQAPASLRAGGGRNQNPGGGGRGGSLSPFDGMDGGRPGIQTQRSYVGPGVTPPGSSAGNAGDKLRQRLGRGGGGGGGARTTSPGGQSPFAPPPSSQQQSGGYSRGGGGGGGDYEDRFAAGGMYDGPGGAGGGGGGGGRHGGGGGGGGGRNDRPFMAANSPWASNESEFSGGRSGGGRQGLPSGPRRPGGLPSGPRMR